MSAKVMVLTFINIFTLVFSGRQLVPLAAGTPEGALGVFALPVDAQISLLTFINILTVSVVGRGAVAPVAGAHVGALEVGTRTICADVWLQTLIHIKALSIPASEAFCAGDTLVRPRGIHTLLIWTRTWSQTLINILTTASRGHAVSTITVFTSEGPHGVDAMSLPTDVRPQALVHVYAVSTLLTGHKSRRANTQETSLGVFTASLGAEVLGLSAFININTLPLLLTEPVAFVADTGVPHRQVNAVSCSTYIRVHSTFINFCYLSRCNHLART